ISKRDWSSDVCSSDLHGVENYDFWIDHWSIYTLIAGVAFVIRYLQTHRGLIPGLILIGMSVILIFSVTLPNAFKWFYGVTEFLEIGRASCREGGNLMC